ncbi:MAG: hypothetical protein Kow0069_12430 [Promethearchaeota archaeon]
MASIVAIVSGTTATGIVVTAYLTAAGLFARARRGEGELVVWEGLILFFLGSFYLGTVVSFFQLLAVGHNIVPGYRGAQICYVMAPLGSAVSQYAGLRLLGKDGWAKPVALAFLATGLLYWYGLLFRPDQTILAVVPDEPGGGLVDFELLSYVQALTGLYLVALVATIGGGFLWLAAASAGDVRRRSLMTAVGCFLFASSGAVDSLLELAYYIFIPRFAMVAGTIVLYQAFSMREPELNGVSVKKKAKGTQASTLMPGVLREAREKKVKAVPTSEPPFREEQAAAAERRVRAKLSEPPEPPE